MAGARQDIEPIPFDEFARKRDAGPQARVASDPALNSLFKMQGEALDRNNGSILSPEERQEMQAIKAAREAQESATLAALSEPIYGQESAEFNPEAVTSLRVFEDPLAAALEQVSRPPIASSTARLLGPRDGNANKAVEDDVAFINGYATGNDPSLSSGPLPQATQPRSPSLSSADLDRILSTADIDWSGEDAVPGADPTTSRGVSITDDADIDWSGEDAVPSSNPTTPPDVSIPAGADITWADSAPSITDLPEARSSSRIEDWKRDDLINAWAEDNMPGNLARFSEFDAISLVRGVSDYYLGHIGTLGTTNIDQNSAGARLLGLLATGDYPEPVQKEARAKLISFFKHTENQRLRLDALSQISEGDFKNQLKAINTKTSVKYEDFDN